MSFFTVPPNQLSVDSCIVGTPDFYIVETDADATAANAAGFPSIAFPNNFRNDENYKIIIDISLKSKRIFIINSTNDTARLGEIGMRLAAQGLAVFILSIPVDTPSGTKGLEDYFKTNQPADFKALVKKAPGFIDLLIANLPENFPHALPDLRDKILPLLLRVDTTTQKHYANLMSKKVKTTTKIITDMLDKLISRTKADEKSADQSEEIDPEIQAAAMALLQDPQVFKKRIDAINLSGVVGERTNISLYFVTLDSRLSKDFGKPGQRALALKSAGHFGAGKSFSLSSCLTIYPPKAYHLLTSGSEKSLYLSLIHI